MFCEKCGKQLPDGSAFCDNCGAKIEAATDPVQPANEKKPFVLTKKHKIMGLAGIAVIVVAIIIAIIVSVVGKNVKLDKYLTITDKGYNGYGSVNYDVDFPELFERLTGEDVSAYETLEDLESLSNAAQIMADAAALESGINVEVKYPDGKAYNKLSNDDVVTFTITLSESAAKRFGVKAKPATVEHKVAELADANVFDVLANFEVEFEGYSGTGDAKLVANSTNTTVGNVTFTVAEGQNYVSYTNNSDGYGGTFYVDITADDLYNLSNDDVVTLTVSGANAESLSSYGVILDGLTKEVKVEGLEEAATFDLLANHTVIFTGVDGDGQAVINATDSETTVGNITFTTYADDPKYVYWEENGDSYNDGSLYIYFDNNAYDLSVGDTVTIKCDYGTDYLAEYGVVLEGMSKDFTVETLGKYATALADISEDSLTALSEAYQEDLMNRLYDDWGDVVHNSWKTYKDQVISEDMALYKTIMTTPKNTSSSTHSNLWLVFSVTLKDDSMEKATKYYFYYTVEDIVVDADGAVDMEADYYVSKSDGYTDYNEIYSDRIESFNLNIEVAK